MRRLVLLSTLIALGAAGIAAQQAAQPQTAEIQKVKDNLYMIKGGGGNTAAFITANGVVIVDTKLAGWGQRIMDKIRSVTDKPVTTIINTHTHGDHTGSNEFFPASVEIVAQENTKANMAKMPAVQGDKAQFLPDKTYKDKLTLFSGPIGSTSTTSAPGTPTATPSSCSRRFASRTPATCSRGKGTPLIDTDNGGSGVAYPKTLKKAASKIKGVDTVITGHSDVLPVERRSANTASSTRPSSTPRGPR